MRGKLNLHSSVDRRVTSKLGMSRMPLAGVPQMPLEWLDSGSWKLPSGKALAEFAFEAGFLAPLLFNVKRFGAANRFGKGSHS